MKNLVMKNLVMKGLLLYTALALSFTWAQRVGDEAADFNLVDGDGNLVTLSEQQGTPLILNFWASWCVPCVEELPLFEQIHKQINEGSDEPVLNVQLINNNEKQDTALDFLVNELDISLRSGFDASKDQKDAFADQDIKLDKTLDVLKNYRVRGMPTTFFIDADGVIQNIKIGLLLQNEVPDLLASIGVAFDGLEIDAEAHNE